MFDARDEIAPATCPGDVRSALSERAPREVTAELHKGLAGAGEPTCPTIRTD